jgi:hypothetical protein
MRVFIFSVATFPYLAIAVEWFALLLRSSEVPVSNLGPKTGYPD